MEGVRRKEAAEDEQSSATLEQLKKQINLKDLRRESVVPRG